MKCACITNCITNCTTNCTAEVWIDVDANALFTKKEVILNGNKAHEEHSVILDVAGCDELIRLLEETKAALLEKES